MFIDSKEQEMLNKLGFELVDNKIVPIDKNNKIENMRYAGFNMFVTNDNRVFEKKGEELVELESEELQAERRFIQNNH